jgi:hypothetical protein
MVRVGAEHIQIAKLKTRSKSAIYREVRTGNPLSLGGEVIDEGIRNLLGLGYFSHGLPVFPALQESSGIGLGQHAGYRLSRHH